METLLIMTTISLISDECLAPWTTQTGMSKFVPIVVYCPPHTSITICPHCCILPTLHIHHNLSPLLYIAHLTHPSQSVPIVVYCPPHTSITICPHCCILPISHIHHNLSPLLYIAHITHPSQSVPIVIYCPPYTSITILVCSHINLFDTRLKQSSTTLSFKQLTYRTFN